MNSRQLVKFIVLSIELILQTIRPTAKHRNINRKSKLVECIVVKESDFGIRDTQYTCISHLGNILHEGDYVLGYDLSTASWTNEREYTQDLLVALPDVILVRKVKMIEYILNDMILISIFLIVLSY